MTTVMILNHNPVYEFRKFCRVSMGVEYTDMEWKPKNEKEYWIKQFIAEHSTVRILHFVIYDTLPRAVAMQLVRHTDGHPQPICQSSRPDWTGKERSTDPNELKMFAMVFTPESFLKMARKRLCNRTERQTQATVKRWVMDLRDSGIPLLEAVAACAVPQCEYRGGKCTELKGCGKFASVLDKGDKHGESK